MKPLLLETIRCENGRLQNLRHHQQRLERSQRQVLGLRKFLTLEDITVPPEARSGLYKCRVLYREEWEKVEFLPYSIRPVRSLRLMPAEGLSYDFKYAAREAIQQLFEKRAGADDVLFTRKGLITDTSYANVALFDGRRWYTPRQPLLAGTRRAALIAAGKLALADISATGLAAFKELRLINAMMGLEEGPAVPVQQIGQ